MSLTYRWAVKSLQVKNETSQTGAAHDKAVVQTYWECVGVNENGTEGNFQGATPFTSVDVPEGEFTAFEDLTEAIVLKWIQDHVAMMPNYQEHIDEQILRQIDGIENVVSDAPMPWAPEEDVTPPLPDDAPATPPEDGTGE
jgi:hypothetical protein